MNYSGCLRKKEWVTLMNAIWCTLHLWVVSQDKIARLDPFFMHHKAIGTRGRRGVTCVVLSTPSSYASELCTMNVMWFFVYLCMYHLDGHRHSYQTTSSYVSFWNSCFHHDTSSFHVTLGYNFRVILLRAFIPAIVVYTVFARQYL